MPHVCAHADVPNFALGEQVLRLDLPDRGGATANQDPFQLDEEPLRSRARLESWWVWIISSLPGGVCMFACHSNYVVTASTKRHAK